MSKENKKNNENKEFILIQQNNREYLFTIDAFIQAIKNFCNGGESGKDALDITIKKIKLIDRCNDMWEGVIGKVDIKEDLIEPK